MKLLIIGGTLFLGKHIVKYALEKGHDVTIFNRGKSNPNLFDNVKHIQGDRNSDLEKLSDEKWDAVIDTCGYFPKQVKMSAEYLKDKAEVYCFVSTISVYKDMKQKGSDENYPLGTTDDVDADKITGENYGPLKALCEKAVIDVFGESKSFIPRPGLIVGPDDISDRMNYWVLRGIAGGKILCPGKPENEVQIIDVRDLSEWIVDACDKKVSGVYNAVGPSYTLTMDKFIDSCIALSDKSSKKVWIDDDFLMKNEVGMYSEMPLWIARVDGYLGADTVNISKAVNAGLKFRSLESTLKDTLEWLEGAGKTLLNLRKMIGMHPDREKELLEKYEKNGD